MRGGKEKQVTRVDSVVLTFAGHTRDSCRYIDREGNGAANNWGLGYTQGNEHRVQMMDILTHEAENSDSLEVRRAP